MDTESFQNTNSLILVPFTLGDLRIALHLSSVTRVFRAVTVLALPGAPPIVAGVIDLHGSLVPVINLRKRLHLPDRLIAPSDQILLAEVSDWTPGQLRKRAIALLVDTVLTVAEVRSHEVASGVSIVPGLENVDGIARLADGLLLIYDLDRCLSLSEGRALDAALELRTNAYPTQP